MKLVLIQPPVQDFYDTDIRLQPLGLASLKSAVKTHLPHIKVVLKDFHHGWGRKTTPFPKEFHYLKEYYAQDDKSPFSSFRHYYHFGSDFRTIAAEVAREKPDLVGISALFSPYYREVLHCASAIKQLWRGPILLGGSQISAMPVFMLSHPDVDFIIRGEGERPLVELLRALLRGRGLHKVPNLGFKKNGRLFLNRLAPNYSLPKIPPPDFSDFSPKRYTFEKKPICFIMTSRGCPYHCSFCSVHKTFGHSYRRRSNDSILEELRQRYRQGYRVFDFEDDNFAFHKEQTLNLCLQIERSFPNKDIQLLAMNGICYWTLEKPLLQAMKRAGFTHLNLSLVSTNPSLLRKIRRPSSLKKYRAVVQSAFALGFQIVSYQILGLPGDSIPSMIKSLRVHAQLPVLLGASPFYLVPASPLAGSSREADKEMAFKARLTAMGPENSHSKRETIYTFFITSRILNFLKGFTFHKPEISLRQALAFARKRDLRSQSGGRLLETLLQKRRLYAWTPQGDILLPKFDSELFFKIWKNLGKIVTQKGQTIRLDR